MELLRTTTERLVTAVAAVYTPFMKPKSCWDLKLGDAVGGRMRSWLRGKAGIKVRSGRGKVGTMKVGAILIIVGAELGQGWGQGLGMVW